MFKKFKKIEVNDNILYVLIIFLWIFFLYFLLDMTSDAKNNFTGMQFEPEFLGQIGDALNHLTSVFAGLAFAAVFISVRLQKKELSETKQEFSLQRKSMELQQFDNKFFQMLGVFNDVIKTIKTDEEYTSFKAMNVKISLFMYKVEKEDFSKKYRIFNSREDNITLKYYFLNLYQVLKYIDDTKVLEETKKKEYTNIVRAQLSKYELVLLFYNCIGIVDVVDSNKYKVLVIKYNFFEHITLKDLKYEYKKAGQNSEHVIEKILNTKIIDYLLLEYKNNEQDDNNGAFGKNNEINEYIKTLLNNGCSVCVGDRDCF